MNTPIYDKMMKTLEDLRVLRSQLMVNSEQSPVQWTGTLNK